MPASFESWANSQHSAHKLVDAQHEAEGVSERRPSMSEQTKEMSFNPAERLDEPLFDSAIYRQFNLDLRSFDDVQLIEHFRRHPHEQRVFGRTESTVSFMSMRWLRGEGLEVGAGANPTPLFGNATAMQIDCDVGLAFGGNHVGLQGDIEDITFARNHAGCFDFVVASHVLEHADSFIRAVENCCVLTRPGGVVYLVLPDVRFLHDKNWIPWFDFAHHRREYDESLFYARLHDEAYIAASREGIDHINSHAAFPAGYREAILGGTLPQQYRFLHHKHNYTFAGWLQLLFEVCQFLGDRFVLEDARYGHERLDCHFIIRTTS